MSLDGLDVLHVTSAHTVTDTRIFVKQACSLAERYRVGIIGPGDAKKSWDAEGVHLETLLRPKHRLERFTWFGQALFRRILAIAPDIVHLHDPDLLQLLPRLKRHGIKVIYDAHEDFSQAPLSREWLGPRWVRGAVSLGFDHIERHVAQRADGVVVADRQLAARFAGASVVRNYLVESEWSTAGARPASEAISCLYVGDITRARGAVRMCDAIQAAWEHGIAMKLDLVGPVSLELRKEVEVHPARPHIAMHGRLGRADVATRMAQADVALCLPEPLPAYQSALPVKVLEYLAMKLPVVATDSPRLRAETGLASGVALVSPDAPVAHLAATIRSAQNLDPKERDHLRAHVFDAYNWKRECEALFALYDQVFAKTGSKLVYVA